MNYILCVYWMTTPSQSVARWLMLLFLLFWQFKSEWNWESVNDCFFRSSRNSSKASTSQRGAAVDKFSKYFVKHCCTVPLGFVSLVPAYLRAKLSHNSLCGLLFAWERCTRRYHNNSRVYISLNDRQLSYNNILNCSENRLGPPLVRTATRYFIVQTVSTLQIFCSVFPISMLLNYVSQIRIWYLIIINFPHGKLLTPRPVKINKNSFPEPVPLTSNSNLSFCKKNFIYEISSKDGL